MVETKWNTYHVEDTGKRMQSRGARSSSPSVRRTTGHFRHWTSFEIPVSGVAGRLEDVSEKGHLSR